MDLQTAYGVLGVRPGASEREVRDAHQRLSASWQPARFQQDPAQRQQAEAAWAQINLALDSIARAGFPATPGAMPVGSGPHAQGYPPNAFAPAAPNMFAQPYPPGAQPYSGPPPFPPPSAPPYAGPQPYGGPMPPLNAFPGAPYPGAPPPGTQPFQPNPFAPDLAAQRAKKRSRGFVLMGVGFALILLGAIITGATHESAVRHGGGTYVIAYGPIVVGVINFFKGLFNVMSA